jgi:uncharacterized YigZ family protein
MLFPMTVTRDDYTTLGAHGRAETKVQASRFIGRAMPVHDRAAIESALAALRKEYHDATHHCYAYRLGAAGDDFRAHDDGEPAGSAGRPILAAIDHEGLSDVLIVVTRYFGGTKLGVGGLMKAYGAAAGAALASVPRLKMFALEQIEVSFPHEMVGPVMHVCSATGANIASTDYNGEVHLHLEIRTSRADALRAALLDRTRGAVSFK